MSLLRPNWPAASRVYGTHRTDSGSLFHSLTAQIARGVLSHPQYAAVHRVAAVEARTQESFFIDLFS